MVVSVVIESVGASAVKSNYDVIGIVGIAGKGDGTPRLIHTLSGAIAVYGEPLNNAPKAGKTISNYGLVDAIKTIYRYAQVPIIAINGWNGSSFTPVAAEEYTFSNDIINLDDVNVSSVVVTNLDESTTYIAATDYSLDVDAGVVARLDGGAIAADATIKVSYSIPNFSAVAWTTLIPGLSVEIEGKTPTILITAGVTITDPIADALETTATAMNAIAVYTQPGVSPSAAVPFTDSRHAIAVFPSRIITDGVEESSSHFAGILASQNFWENPISSPVLGNSDPAIAVSLSDQPILLEKGMVWLSDRVMLNITTSNQPISFARLQMRAEAIAKEVAQNWIGKPLDTLHIEGLGQALRDRFNMEPSDSLLSISRVDFNANSSDIPNRKLAYNVVLAGSTTESTISEIVIYLS